VNSLPHRILGRILPVICLSVATGFLVMVTTDSPANASPAASCGSVFCIVEFFDPGMGQSWVVPMGVDSETITLFGAIGGSFDGTPGGDAAEVVGTLTQPPNTTMIVDVGSQGTSTAVGGVNGGGNGGMGGGGGGGTDVKIGGSDQLVAGGGGGGGENVQNLCSQAGNSVGGAGGNADRSASNGSPTTTGSFPNTVTFAGGDGGAAGTSGGVGGAGGDASSPTDTCSDPPPTTSSGSPGADGSSNQGGSGGGGGGGGGFFGGGSGGQPGHDSSNPEVRGAYGGGGGGSSFPQADLISDINGTANVGSGLVNGGNGEVLIEYAVPASTTTNPEMTTTTSTTSTNHPVTEMVPTTPPGTPALATTGTDLYQLVGIGSTFIAGGILAVSASVIRRKNSVLVTRTDPYEKL
jgi:hypothetical protein